jgi:hypothetical protein
MGTEDRVEDKEKKVDRALRKMLHGPVRDTVRARGLAEFKARGLAEFNPFSGRFIISSHIYKGEVPLPTTGI